MGDATPSPGSDEVTVQGRRDELSFELASLPRVGGRQWRIMVVSEHTRGVVIMLLSILIITPDSTLIQ